MRSRRPSVHRVANPQSASTNLEKTMCIFIMIVGVIAFSFASGSLTNYIAETDKRNETLDSKLKILENLFKDHNVPQGLYTKIKKSL